MSISSIGESSHHTHFQNQGVSYPFSSSTAFSPSSVHPSEWTAVQVSRWLQTLQPSSIAQSHAGKFREQGIEGDVLLQLDAEALRELGISSVGHRLVLLKAIYELKRKWNIEVEPDAWRPEVAEESKGVDRIALPPTIASVASVDLVRALLERDERVWALEQEIARLVDWLRQCTDDQPPGSTSAFKLVEPLRPYLPPAKAHSTLPFAGYSREDAILRPHGSVSSLSSTTVPLNGTMYSAPLAHDTREADDHRPSSRGLRSAAGQGAIRTGFGSRERDQLHSPFGVPGSSFSQSGFSPTNSNTPSATPTTAHPPGSTASDANRGASSATVALGQGSGLASGTGNATTVLSGATNGAKRGKMSANGGTSESGGGGSSTSDHTVRSFRVTLEDPCYKVLPAALKKYKINDDWRQYALFLCYSGTERCLSYDEKPLLLFQKLKENKQDPLFMLRHIRDVKSPIAIANAKAAARKSPSASMSGEGEKVASNPEAAGKVAGAVAKLNATAKREENGSAGDASTSDTATNSMIASPPGQPIITGPASQLLSGRDASNLSASLDSTPEKGVSRSASAASPSDTFAISIYPYVSEREDEFDVSVGDTFVVKSKAKGWWVVQRDSRASGQSNVSGIVYDADGIPVNGGEVKSGWVPAGCLLETRQPLSRLITIPEGLDNESVARVDSPTSPSTPVASTIPMESKMRQSRDSAGTATSTPSALTTYMANVPIPPSVISSTSTEGILLMDYDDDEENLHLKKDQRLRVFKRYNHWSYCVEEKPGHVRAWLPSWYIGKVRDASTSSRSHGGAAGSSHRERAGSKASSTFASSSASNPSSAVVTSDDMPSFSTTLPSSSGEASDQLMPSTPRGTPGHDRLQSMHTPSASHSLSGTPTTSQLASSGNGLSAKRSASPLSVRAPGQTAVPLV